MIRSLLVTLCIIVCVNAESQYYYKDILSSQQTSEQMTKYRKAGIREVTVTSFESDGSPTEDFTGSQQIRDNYSQVETKFNTVMAGESSLTTWFNAAGQVVRTRDTTDGSGSVSEYQYDNNGRIKTITNTSTSPGMHIEKEVHHWQYNSNGKPEKLIRVKNDVDTMYISFVLDEKGNVAEENATRGGASSTSYYYYYDNNNRLTDIVTYNQKARRLLPIYVFEYNSNGNISSMMVVPEGTDNYQRWVYEYNGNGLKTRETCFNKRKQLLGKIEYAYR